MTTTQGAYAVTRAKAEPWAGAETIVVPISRLVPWKGGPRIFRTKLKELGTSMKREGQTTPCVCRVSKEDPSLYEIADGTRRRSAAELVGIPELRIEVRVLTDAEMLDLAMSTNADREGFHPIEEADAYRRMRDEYGRTVGEIALRHNVSEQRVHARIQLLQLEGKPREDFEGGKMGTGVALQLARLSPIVQDRAWSQLLSRSSGNGFGVSESEVRGYLQRTVFLPMAEAPFSRKDKKLLAGVGSCEECPKRTGNQTLLFEGDVEEDACGDPSCWTAKRDARTAQLRKVADERKQAVLEGPGAKGIFDHSLNGTHGWMKPISYASGFVEVDRPIPSFADSSKTLVKILGEAIRSTATLAVDPDGNPRLLVEVKRAGKLLRDAGQEEYAKKLPNPTAEQRAEAERKDAAKAERETAKATKARVDRALEYLVEEVESRGLAGLASWFALVMVRHASHEQIVHVAKRRKLFEGKTPDRQTMERLLLDGCGAHSAKADGLAVELAATRGVLSDGDLLKRACAVYGFESTKPPKKVENVAPKSKAKISKGVKPFQGKAEKRKKYPERVAKAGFTQKAKKR